MSYEIVYCKRRSVGLKIQNGILTVRAPYGTPKKYIEEVVRKHEAWIGNAMKREAAKRGLYEHLSDDDIKALRKRARAYFTEKCEDYCEENDNWKTIQATTYEGITTGICRNP